MKIKSNRTFFSKRSPGFDKNFLFQIKLQCLLNAIPTKVSILDDISREIRENFEDGEVVKSSNNREF